MTAGPNRRSERVLLTLPLHAQGTAPDGRPFECSARTVNVNRYGAQVRIPFPLQSGQEIRVANIASSQAASFRVVGPVAPNGDTGGDYGVECLEDMANIWQIEFPLLGEEKPSDATALVECRGCHTIQLANLTLNELNTLRTIGALARACDFCQGVNPFRYAELQTLKELPALLGWSPTIGKLFKPRGHARVFVQVPLGIRNEKGEAEVTRSENVSKEGYCFTTKTEYPVDRFIFVVFPGDPLIRDVEIPARIAWRAPINGPKRYAYGVHAEITIN